MESDELGLTEMQSALHHARMLAAVCRKHGYTDGEKAHQATADALAREIAERA